jgi:hypothetical protein
VTLLVADAGVADASCRNDVAFGVGGRTAGICTCSVLRPERSDASDRRDSIISGADGRPREAPDTAVSEPEVPVIVLRGAMEEETMLGVVPAPVRSESAAADGALRTNSRMDPG